MKKIRFHSMLRLLLLSFVSGVQAQATYQVADESKMVIKGTSTLHDWVSDVTELQGEAQVNVQDQQPRFQQVTLTIPVESIRSGKSSMDKNTYEALQEKSIPTSSLRSGRFKA